MATGAGLYQLLLALIAVTLAARGAGAVLKFLGQPPVIGEIAAGILLGPSCLGHFAPRASSYLFPSAAASNLHVIAEVGVLLFMFLVGLELDLSLLRKNRGVTCTIAGASILFPLLLGGLAAFVLYPRFGDASVPFSTFALFCAISLAVTAFPVLARILKDQSLDKTPLGVIALGAAAINDLAAWCLLAIVAGLARASAGTASRVLFFTALYVVGMVWLVRPLLARLVARQELLKRVSPDAMALVFVGVLSSALATEAAGIHALFGAFAFGAVVPHDSRLAKSVRDKLEDLVVILLLPAFFASTGLRTQIGLLNDGEAWLFCGGLVLLASAGKIGGGVFAARVSGLPWRDAAGVGVLMNTRGLMELVVLNVGLDLGVISPTLFAMLVLMALLTTFATTPLLRLVGGGPAANAAGALRPH